MDFAVKRRNNNNTEIKRITFWTTGPKACSDCSDSTAAIFNPDECWLLVSIRYKPTIKYKVQFHPQMEFTELCHRAMATCYVFLLLDGASAGGGSVLAEP